MGILLYAIMGWCGTKYPGWWRFPVPPHPDPDPYPWRGYAVLSLVGIAAGIFGGIMFNKEIMQDQLFAGQQMIASGMFAFGASAIITGIGAGIMNNPKQ